MNGWHREDIKAELRKRHGSISDLAAALNVDASTISTVLRRRGASTRIELLIARAIDQTPHALWPDRWTPDGIPRPAHAGRIHTRNVARENNQITRAA